MSLQHIGHRSLFTTPTADPYADWQPERPAYVRIGRDFLNEITLLEGHVGGALNVSRLKALAAMKGIDPPDGGYCYEVAAIRRLKSNPARGCLRTSAMR